MIKSGYSYWKLTAVGAVLAIALIGLSGLLSVTTMAQEKRTGPPREVDLRAKVKDRKFPDGRRVEIHSFTSGEKIVAEIRDAKFINWFLVAADGTEVQGVVRRKHTTTTTTATCTATYTSTTSTTDSKTGRTTTTTTATIAQVPCPANIPGDTFKP